MGDPAHVRDLLADGCSSLALHERDLVLTFDGDSAELAELYRETFAPVIHTEAAPAGDPRAARRSAPGPVDLLRTAGRGAGHAYPYLEVVGTRAGRTL